MCGVDTRQDSVFEKFTFISYLALHAHYLYVLYILQSKQPKYRFHIEMYAIKDVGDFGLLFFAYMHFLVLIQMCM